MISKANRSIKEAYTIPEIKSIIAPLAQKYGIERVYLFGSYARGDFNEESDIDLRIDTDNINTLIELSRLHIEFRKAFDKEIDLLMTEAIRPDFLSNISKDEVLLYEQK